MFGFFSWFRKELGKAIRGAFEDAAADGVALPPATRGEVPALPPAQPDDEKSPEPIKKGKTK